MPFNCYTNFSLLAGYADIEVPRKPVQAKFEHQACLVWSTISGESENSV